MGSGASNKVENKIIKFDVKYTGISDIDKVQMILKDYVKVAEQIRNSITSFYNLLIRIVKLNHFNNNGLKEAFQVWYICIKAINNNNPLLFELKVDNFDNEILSEDFKKLLKFGSTVAFSIDHEFKDQEQEQLINFNVGICGDFKLQLWPRILNSFLTQLRSAVKLIPYLNERIVSFIKLIHQTTEANKIKPTYGFEIQNAMNFDEKLNHTQDELKELTNQNNQQNKSILDNLNNLTLENIKKTALMQTKNLIPTQGLGIESLSKIQDKFNHYQNEIKEISNQFQSNKNESNQGNQSILDKLNVGNLNLENITKTVLQETKNIIPTQGIEILNKLQDKVNNNQDEIIDNQFQTNKNEQNQGNQSPINNINISNVINFDIKKRALNEMNKVLPTQGLEIENLNQLQDKLHNYQDEFKEINNQFQINKNEQNEQNNNNSPLEKYKQLLQLQANKIKPMNGFEIQSLIQLMDKLIIYLKEFKEFSNGYKNIINESNFISQQVIDNGDVGNFTFENDKKIILIKIQDLIIKFLPQFKQKQLSTNELKLKQQRKRNKPRTKLNRKRTEQEAMSFPTQYYWVGHTYYDTFFSAQSLSLQELEEARLKGEEVRKKLIKYTGVNQWKENTIKSVFECFTWILSAEYQKHLQDQNFQLIDKEPYFIFSNYLKHKYSNQGQFLMENLTIWLNYFSPNKFIKLWNYYNDFLDRHNLLDDKKYHFHFSIIDLPYYNQYNALSSFSKNIRINEVYLEKIRKLFEMTIQYNGEMGAELYGSWQEIIQQADQINYILETPINEFIRQSRPNTFAEIDQLQYRKMQKSKTKLSIQQLEI